MDQRIIPLDVKNEYILGAGVVVGAAGSHDEVLLELDFRGSPAWLGTTKRAIFHNALGEDGVTVILTTSLLSPGQTEVYLVPVPARAKAVAGECSLTLEGCVIEGEREVLRITTEEALFRVLPNSRVTGEEDITPTLAEQLQSEIDGIKGPIQTLDSSVAAAAESEKNAAASATAAEVSATAAEESKTSAGGSATNAAASAASAAQDAASAESDRIATAQSKENAEASASGAAQSASAAAQSEGNASASASSAAASATAAAESEKNAAASAASAATNATATAESERAAAQSEENAEKSASDAEAWAIGKRDGVDVGADDPAYQNNAKYYKNLASDIAGGDWATKADARGYVAQHAADSVAHITAAERTAWNAKANETDLEAHTGNSDIHVTASEKSAWSGKAKGGVSVTFTAADWSGSSGAFTLTIPQSTHKRENADFIFALYGLCSDGTYAKNTWSVLELDTEYTASTGAFKLCSDTAFAGKITFLG